MRFRLYPGVARPLGELEGRQGTKAGTAPGNEGRRCRARKNLPGRRRQPPRPERKRHAPCRRRKRARRPVAPEPATSVPVEEMSGVRHGGFAELYAAEPITVTPSLWDEMPRAQVPDFRARSRAGDRRRIRAGARDAEAAVNRPRRMEPAVPPPQTRAEPKFDGRSIAVGERADADVRTVTVTPKSVSGFKLPPSNLLHRSEESQVVREDELRTEAQVLVQKCAEFDVRGPGGADQSRPRW